MLGGRLLFLCGGPCVSFLCRTSGMSGGDGYYIRDSVGKVHGPFAEGEFDALRRSGELDILKPQSAWRTAMGMAYKVTFKREYNSVCTCAACGHAWELFIVVFTMVATLWSMTMLKWDDPNNGNAVYFLIVLTAITMAMVVVTIRTVYKRWQKEASEVFTSEV